jgi:hypothetical protein
MKDIRIRHRGDQQMYLGESGWTLNCGSAKVFDSALQALAFVIHRQIGNAELVAKILDSNTEIAVAI